jgi:hypothetical protein
LARNLLGRVDDPEILPWTPREWVKAILLERFRRRLERWDFDFPPEEANFFILKQVEQIVFPSTVPGRTRDTRPPVSLVDERRKRAGQSESETPSAAIRQRACLGQI